MINIQDLRFKPCHFGGASEPTQLAGVAAEIDSGRIQHGVWESGPGELDLQFDWNETVFVIEGSAKVENVQTGVRWTLNVGDLMSFEKGSHWRWRIPWKFKKVFTLVESNL